MMKRITLFILLICLLSTLSAAAQKPIPDFTDLRLEVVREEGALSLSVPVGWQYYNPGTDTTINYASMSNLHDPELEGVPAQVQIVFRPIEELLVPIDTSLPNPGLQYLRDYAQQMGLQHYGAYTEPIEVRDGFFRGGLMLYVEQQTAPRFGEGETLALAVATYMGNDTLGIILLDGPVREWVALLSLWAYLLDTLQWNDQPVRLLDIGQKLISFENPEMLVERFVSGNTEPPNIAAIAPAVTLQLTRVMVGTIPLDWAVMPGWEQEESDEHDLLLTAPDESGTFSIEVQPVEPRSVANEYTIPQEALLDHLDAEGGIEPIGEMIVFLWNDEYPAIGARVEYPDEQIGYVFSIQIADYLVLLDLRVQLAMANPHLRAFLDSVTQVQINDAPVSPNNFWGAIFRLSEAE